MTDAPKSHNVFDFGNFRLDNESQILWCDGKEIHLAKRPFCVLAYLIENRDRVVSRNELFDKFWDGHDVYDDALRKAVGTIRKVLNDLEKPPKFIETRWGSGYRFIGEVSELNGNQVKENQFVQFQTVNEDIKNSESSGFKKKTQKFPYILFLILSISLIIFAAFGLFAFRQPPEKTAALKETVQQRRSIAVMPLKNLTGNASNDYLTDGITESLINELSRIQELKVTSRGSVFTFKNQEIDAREVGEKLGVESILEGGIRQSGDKIRVEVRLVDTKDGSVIWASNYEEKPFKDIFVLQDGIVCQLVTDLKLKICGDVPTSERYTKNIEAYQFYLQGLYCRNTPSHENLQKAREFYEKALKVEPDYALAHEGLATVFMLMEFNSAVPPGSVAPKALFHAQKALEQDENLADANIVLGAVKTLHNYDLATREKYYLQALIKNPNHRTARLWLSNIYLARGEFERAETEILRVQTIDPLSFGVRLSLSELYLYWRKPDQVIEQINLMPTTDQNVDFKHLMLARAYLQKGDDENFFENAEMATSFPGVNAAILAEKGEIEAAKKLVKKIAESEEGKKSPSTVASLYAYLGEKDNAFEWLEKAYSMRQADLISLKIESNFDSLHDDPRYKHLLRRINLAE